MSNPRSRHVLSVSLLVLMAAISSNACSGNINSGAPATAGTAGAEQAVGERLFMDTRFAQAFKAFLDAGGDVNDPNAGDPVVIPLRLWEPRSRLKPLSRVSR